MGRRSRSSGVPVLVTIRKSAARVVSPSVVRRWAKRMLACLELDEAELSVLFTDDREIHELNFVFRQKDRPTDVLAFAMREGAQSATEPIGADGGKPLEMLGDVVVSVETARRQAVRRGRRVPTELRELLAHGLLHLVGFDHQTKAEERVMRAETRRLCRAAQR